MPSNTDIVRKNIQRQIALNGVQINIASIGGAYQFVDTSTGQPIQGPNDVGNYALSQAPAIYQNSMRAEVYNYAKGMFGGRDVPPEMVEVLATMATYYSVQSGVSVTSLFRRGVLWDEFMATINSLRNKTSQIGFAGLNLSPNWANNQVLRASVAKAMEPFDAFGTIANRSKYDDKPPGFTYNATDVDRIYIRRPPGVVLSGQQDRFVTTTWNLYVPEQPVWPA